MSSEVGDLQHTYGLAPPRAVLEGLLRRSVSDGEWRERFEPLLA